MSVESDVDISGWTYTSSIQLANVDRDRNVCKNIKFNDDCYTIMNSDGTAIDPSSDKKNRTCNFGAEISITHSDKKEMINMFKSFLFNHPESRVNNSCQIINEIKVPKLNLAQLKSIVSYYWKYRETIIQLSDYISVPDELQQRCCDIGKTYHDICMYRFNEQTDLHSGSHHAQMPKYVYDFKMRSNSIQEFHHASRLDIHGNVVRSYSQVAPIGIDTLSASNNVTFRMHSSTINWKEYQNILEWDARLLEAMLTDGKDPLTILTELFGDISSNFPISIKLDIELYRKFLETKNDGTCKRREEVKYYLNTLK